MNVIITTETRFQKGRDGTIYTDNEFASGYSFFKRYLEVFDSVTVVGRLQEYLTTGNAKVTGSNVFFKPIPYYLGPTQYLFKKFQINKTIRSVFLENHGHSAFITRSPGNIASNLIKVLTKRRHPFGMEVVGDPYDVFAPGAIKHPLRPIFRIWFANGLRLKCLKASGVAYVTEFSLQRRYPPAQGIFNTHYSSIQLDASDFVASPPLERFRTSGFEIISVGTMAQLYKAQDVLLKAFAICVQEGLDARLTLVGDGKFRKDLEHLVDSLELGEYVRFAGQLPSGDAVRQQLDNADLFVLPSKGEGLPRAMIEAMARGLPCIGSSASGIPELLSSEDLVQPGDIHHLAQKIIEVLSSPERLRSMSERNLEKAKDYRNDILQRRRNAFYEEIKKKTKDYWDKNKGKF